MEDLKDNFREILSLALAEDIGGGDVTSLAVIPARAVGSYVFTAREEIIFCGVDVIKAAFPNAVLKCKDGAKVKKGAIIAVVKGNVRDILAKERSVLNIIQHLSGISTETAKYIHAVKDTKAMRRSLTKDSANST